MAVSHKQSLRAFKAGDYQLIGAKSYFIDRMAPAIENILLPPASTAKGVLEITLADGEAVARASRRRRLLGKGGQERFEGDDVLIDFRPYFPENWAHSLNNCLPLALFVRDFLKSEGIENNVTAIFPARIAGYIRGVFSAFGFGILATDKDVAGRIAVLSVTPLITAIRGERTDWTGRLSAPYLDKFLSTATQKFPEQIFISRKDTRRIRNESEIEQLLLVKDFKKIYPEDYSPAEQFAMFQSAKKIVAVHGAGLAPLIFRKPSAGQFSLIELFTPGHMTNCYRVMAAQLGGRAFGVRGRLQSQMLPSAYDFTAPFKKYSLTDFDIDPHSLERALALADQE